MWLVFTLLPWIKHQKPGERETDGAKPCWAPLSRWIPALWSLQVTDALCCLHLLLTRLSAHSCSAARLCKSFLSTGRKSGCNSLQPVRETALLSPAEDKLRTPLSAWWEPLWSQHEAEAPFPVQRNSGPKLFLCHRQVLQLECPLPGLLSTTLNFSEGKCSLSEVAFMESFLRARQCAQP